MREALFNILGARVEGARVLDLYAGSGALGLEALSRGAAHVTFIDEAAAAVAAIEASIEAMGLGHLTRVVRGRLPTALDRLEGTFDLILVDAPYEDPRAVETLDRSHEKLAPSGTVVYEHASRYNPPERPAGLVPWLRRVYGDSAISLYVPQEGE